MGTQLFEWDCLKLAAAAISGPSYQFQCGMHLTPKLHGLLLKCFCKGVNERVERYLMFVFNSTGSNPFFFLQLWLLRVVMIMSST